MTSRTEQVRMVRVIDGDTVVVMTNQGFLRKPQETRIRLYGIDAPESDQKGGPESTRYLRKLIGGRRRVWMDSANTDQYGRTIGLIYQRKNQPKDSYNLRMVQGGHARPYMTGAQDRARFQAAEESARSKKRGIWKQKNRVDPWEHRKAQKARAERKGRTWKILFALLILAGVMAYLFYRTTS